jgi:general secretion pathway protein G
MRVSGLMLRIESVMASSLPLECFLWKHSSKSSCSLWKAHGFSLVELMVAVAILTILGAISVNHYLRFIDKAQIQGVVRDMREIELSIQSYTQVNGTLPESLEQIGFKDFKDPWGNPYIYLPLNQATDGSPGKGKKENPKDKARKDRNLHPINTDYDLYSMGKDGKSTLPLTAAISRDDIIRANNGAFIGLASEY